MEKEDHVLLTLPTISEAESSKICANNGISYFQSRKSFRRSWNQLSRCQRNLILLGISAACITLVLFLPGDHLIAKSKSESIPNDNSIPNLDDVVGFGHHILREKADQPQNIDREKYPNSESDSILKIYINTDNKKSIELKPVEDIEANVLNVGDEPKIATMTSNTNNIPIGRRGIEQFINNLISHPIEFHGPKNERQRAVVEAFKHSWKGYKEFAWGSDNLKPISMQSYDWFGLGLTIVDSLDTMLIMNLKEEFDEARNWVQESLNFDINRDVNLFEVTIRVLGGLLSSYHLSGDKMFLKKSVELGDRLLPCFLSPSGIPFSDVNLASMTAHSPKWSPDSSTSEVTTLQLEFRDLSRSTHSSKYEEAAQRVSERVHSLPKKNGLVPIFINANTGNFRNFATISLGARGDSYYEYLLKQWIQTGRKENDFLIEDYKTAIDGVISQLVRQTPKERHVYIGELISGKDFKPKMDHLTCYLPGTLILGHKYGMPESHLELAKSLLDTCYQTYIRQPTGLAPEITYFAVNEDEEMDIYVKSNDAHNLLRPEFVESLYYFYSSTGNSTYQDMGWKVFQAFEKYAKLPNGYSSLENVKVVSNVRRRDMMESFWLGETLKYFYLLFSDNRNEINLEKFVINSEAHLFPIRSY